MASNEENTTTVSPAPLTTLKGVLNRALEGAATYDQAIASAQSAGNQALVQFLQQVQQEDQQRAAQAQQLLAQLGDTGKGIADLSH